MLVSFKRVNEAMIFSVISHQIRSSMLSSLSDVDIACECNLAGPLNNVVVMGYMGFLTWMRAGFDCMSAICSELIL